MTVHKHRKEARDMRVSYLEIYSIPDDEETSVTRGVASERDKDIMFDVCLQGRTNAEVAKEYRISPERVVKIIDNILSIIKARRDADKLKQ